MAIHFNRRATQDALEIIARNFYGLPPNDESFTFKDIVIDAAQAISLTNKCYEDAIGLYFNAIASFSLGVCAVVEKHYSWASVQLYYAVYYACRAIMGFDKTIIIRKNGLYSLDIMPSGKTKRLQEQNDHKMTLNSYRKKYKDSDYLLSNKISSIDFYEWITNIREITNYRQVSFCEPHYLDCYNLIVSELKNGVTIATLLERFANDWDLYCFQEETAILSGPYRLINDAAVKYKSQPQRLTVPQRKYIEMMLKKAKCKDLVSYLL